jgi:ribosome-associated translation inhibitor RaiA
MTTPNVDFVGMTPSPALRAEIARHVMRLGHLAPRLSSCHVVLRRSGSQADAAPHFNVHVRATLPGGSFDVGRSPTVQGQEDAYAAVRHAFATLRRQVEEFQAMRQSRERGAA